MAVLATPSTTGTNNAAVPGFAVTGGSYYIANNTGILAPAAANYAPLNAIYTALAARTDSDFYTTINYSAAVESYLAITARSPAAVSGYNAEGYYLVPVVSENSFSLFYTPIGGGDKVYVAFSGFTFTAGVDVNVRFRVVGTSVQAKMWLATGTEPTTWMIDVVDTNITTAGYNGYQLTAGPTNLTVATKNMTIADALGIPVAFTPAAAAGGGRFMVPITAPAAISTAVPSSTATITSNGRQWTPMLVEDYNTDSATGQVRTTYPNAGYFNGFSDTSNLGTYDPDSVLSVSNSILKFTMKTAVPSAAARAAGAPSTARPLVACVVPSGYSTPNVGYSTYGRMSVRMRASATGLGYKFVGIFWPIDDNWNTGEIDWPEADLTGTPRPASAIPGTGKDSSGNPADGKNNVSSMSFVPGVDYFTPHDYSAFHIYTTEWTPEEIRLYDDNKLLLSIPAASAAYAKLIPSVNMRYELQAETFIGQGAVPAATVGTVEVDWIAIWSMNSGYGTSPYGTSGYGV